MAKPLTSSPAQPRPRCPVHHGRVNGNKNHAEMSGVVRYTPNSPKTPPVHQGISGQKTISRNGRQPNIERLCPACQQGHIHTEIYRRKHSNSRQGGGQALVRALAPQVRALVAETGTLQKKRSSAPASNSAATIKNGPQAGRGLCTRSSAPPASTGSPCSPPSCARLLPARSLGPQRRYTVR